MGLLRSDVIRRVALLSAAAAVVAAIVLWLPRLIVAWDVGSGGLHGLSPAQRASAENDVRTTLMQGLGGVAVLIGVYVAWRQMHDARDDARDRLGVQQEELRQTYQAGQEQLALGFEQFRHTSESSQREWALNRETLIVDRIAKAVEHLASQDLAVRVAGLRTLEQIAQISPGDRAVIARMLAAFIAMRAPWTPDDQATLERAVRDDRTWTQPWPHTTGGLFNPPWITDLPTLQSRALDVDTALEVLVRLPDRGGPLALSDVDLRKLHWESSQGVNLEGLHFSGAHFEGSYLADVDFSSSRLLGAHFEGATMFECRFPVEMRKAHLDGAELKNCLFGRDPYGSLLVGGTLRRASIVTSDLRHAGLDHTDCRDATLGRHMQGAGLQGADLRGAKLTLVQLQDSHLQDARLQGASLRGANLTGAELNGAQLDGAFANAETVWPDGFEPRNAGVLLEPGTVLDSL
jgi:uncharacterized protein YjbI with pentapeptide repeats